MSEVTGYAYLIYALKTIGAHRVQFIAEDNLTPEVKNVTWGVKLFGRDVPPDDRITTLGKVESYFDEQTGEHISTHFAKNIVNEDMPTTVARISDFVARHRAGLLNTADIDVMYMPSEN